MLVHHVRRGIGPPVVFVHGFACAGSDWDAQVAQLATRHTTVAVDLRGHGETPGTPEDASVERHAADVVELLTALDLRSVVLAGHSMGCRVVVEAALKLPGRVAGLVLVDGSQGTPAEEVVLRATFGLPGGYGPFIERSFRGMLAGNGSGPVATSIVQRALMIPEPFGARMVLDISRYDQVRLQPSMASLRLPALVVQSTGRDDHGARVVLREGQTTPYLDMVRAALPSATVVIVPGGSHFPHVEAADRTTAAIARFASSIAARADATAGGDPGWR